MIKISRSKQIIFYVAILVFGVFFFFYFYRQASVTENNYLELKVNGRQSAPAVSAGNSTINLDLFNSDKFKNLRSEVAPVQSFPTGKRNPFLPE